MPDIRDYIDFNASRKADCPVCTDGHRRGLTLWLTDSGGVYCHRGCKPEDIYAAVGLTKDKVVPTKAIKSPPKTKIKPTPIAGVIAGCKRLLEDDNPGFAWLRRKGITQEMIEWKRLGYFETRPKGKLRQAVAIPYPVGGGDSYLLKKRIHPWNHAAVEAEDYKPWSQPGIAHITYVAYDPPDAKETYVTEGEWDAIRLGWEVKKAGELIKVCCFSNGASSVPGKDELNKLIGGVSIFYDRNDKPNRKGYIPGKEGALKLARAIGENAKIALVPMPPDCDVHGWDVSDALNRGYTLSHFKKAAAEATAPPTKELCDFEKEGMWNDELLDTAPDCAPFLVPELIPENELSVLASCPRVGKSLLTMGLARAVATGGLFLDRPVTKGAVVYAHLEDGTDKIKEREILQGWTRGLNVFWHEKFKLSQIDKLKEFVEIHDPRLVVIDTLSRANDSPINESSPEIAKVIGPLQDLARDYHCAVILVHHLTKTPAETASSVDVFEQIRGSTAIRATCRAAYIITQGDTGTRLCYEHGSGKGDLRIRKDLETLSWLLIGNWNPQLCEDKVAYIKQLVIAQGPISAKELAGIARLSVSYTHKVLEKLIKDNSPKFTILKQGSRGCYKYSVDQISLNFLGKLEENYSNPVPERDTEDFFPNSQKSGKRGQRDHRDQAVTPLDHDDHVFPRHKADQEKNPPQTVSQQGKKAFSNDFPTFSSPQKRDQRIAAEENQVCANSSKKMITLNPPLDHRDQEKSSTGVVLYVGDKAEVVGKPFAGKIVTILELLPNDMAIVKADSWAIERSYHLSALRFRSRPEAPPPSEAP